MRIVTGRHKGLRLFTPEKGAPTRPTTDRAREGLFSSLASEIPGCHFLDLYSGTGANGIEALSRGAARVVLVERHPKALRCIRKNLELVHNPPEVELVSNTVERYLRSTEESFDLVFADPPFKVPPQKVLAELPDSQAIRPGGLFVIEYRRDRSQRAPKPPEAPEGYTKGKTYRHGEADITFYRRQE
jgi:16S rRNA (guanine(966)-N(2))-methyltransferase RsmD